MNDNDLRNTSHDDYKRLMAEAYPAPKKDIHAAVMAQISAEAEQSNKKAKLLTRQRMNRFVKFGSMAACLVLLVTLGFRVVPMMMKDAAVESSTDTAAPEAADFGYTAAVTSETAAAGGSADGTFKTASLTDGAESPAEAPEAPASSAAAYSAPADSKEETAEEIIEEAVIAEEDDYAEAAAPSVLMYAADSTEEAVEEALPEAESAEDEIVVEEAAAELILPPAGEILVEEPVTEEAAAEEAIVEEAADENGSIFMDGTNDLLMSSPVTSSGGIGTATALKALSYTSEGCLHKDVFGNSFHDIPQSVVSLAVSCADAEAVSLWWNENTGTCGMNIYELLTAFSVPRALFETLYDTTDLWYHHDYSAELLYGGDRSAAYEYYLNGGSFAEQVKRYFEYELKLDLYAEVGSKAYSAWASERSCTSFCQWSLAEFVRDFGVTRDRFTELHTALTDTFAQTYPGYAVVEYDLDKLYGMGADVTDSIARGDMGYITDALYHK